MHRLPESRGGDHRGPGAPGAGRGRSRPRHALTGGAPGAGAGSRIAYVPGLDGLRALAVVAVMAYHGGLAFLPGGFFGVDAFFVLSGFLITTLLLAESATSGRLRLGAFWARRARRLVPALLLVLLFVVLYARYVAAPGTYPGLRGDTLATLLYGANWRFVADGQSYGALTGPVTPLLHMWSLAIEEQFYIVWPLVVLGVVRWRRRSAAGPAPALFGLSVLGALASALDMALRFNPAGNPTTVYLSTDTHAQSLLVGTALGAGLAWWRRRDAARGPTADVRGRAGTMIGAAGVLGVAGCAWAWSQLTYGQSLVFRGGFLLVSLSVAAVVAAVVLRPTAVVSRVLSLAPLRFLGRISYGMYLWHFPIDIALGSGPTHVQGIELFLLRSGVTVGVSTLSYYGLEMPVRTRSGPALARLRLGVPAAVVGGAALLAVATLPVPASGATPPSTTLATAAGGPTGPDSVARAPVRVLLVGDSVALTLGVGLDAAARQAGISLDDQGTIGCGVAMGTVMWADIDGQEQQAPVVPACQSDPSTGVPWPAAWHSWLAAVRPNVVVLLAGRWEVVDRLYDGRRTNILAPAFAAYVKHMLEEAVDVGTSTGARMVLMTAPCYSPADELDGSPAPEDDPRRVEAYNRLVEEVAAEHPGSVAVQDLYSMVCPGGRFTPDLDGVPLRTPDGIHFDTAPGTGAALLAPRILPEWEELGHAQEAAGGTVPSGPLPSRLAPA